MTLAETGAPAWSWNLLADFQPNVILRDIDDA